VRLSGLDNGLLCLDRDVTPIHLGALATLALLLGAAPASPLVSSSGHRALAMTSLDPERIRRIRRAYGGTVNDVLLSVVAGALWDWLVARGDHAAPVAGQATSLLFELVSLFE
jgi:diacylglycerol O-acyltransferase